MGEKGGRDWFNIAKTKNKAGGSSSVTARLETAAKTISVVCVDDQPPSPEQALTRKRKVNRVGEESRVSQKGKRTVEEPTDPVIDQYLLRGMWDPGFDLRHKIDFNFDAAEEKVMSEISEQKMAELCLDFLLRGSTATFKLAYASNRGNLHVEVERLKKQLDETKVALQEANAAHAECSQKTTEAAQIIVKGRLLMDNLKRAEMELRKERDRLAGDLEAARKTITGLTTERDDLQKTVAKCQETQEEMLEAIQSEHTKGFKNAMRQLSYLAKVSPEGMGFDIEQDVYQGRMVPIDTIPEGNFTAEGDVAEEIVETTVEETGPAVAAKEVPDAQNV